MENHLLGCEACRVTVTHTIFAPKTLLALSELGLPDGSLKTSPQSTYNQTLFKLLKNSCNNLQIPPRYESNQVVKIKGLSDESTSWKENNHFISGEKEDRISKTIHKNKNFIEEMYQGCIALTKTKSSTNRLLKGLSIVHHSLFHNGEAARGTLKGYPLNFLEMISTPNGREIVNQVTNEVCHVIKPFFCPLVSKIPSNDCNICKHVLSELEMKILRLNNHNNHHNNHKQSELKKKDEEEIDSELISQEIENVCEEIKWRHFENHKFDEQCQRFIEKKDNVLTKHLEHVFKSGISVTTVFKGKHIQSIYSDLCECSSVKNMKKYKKKKKKSFPQPKVEL